MEFTIDKADLVDALTIASKAAGMQPVICCCVLIEMDGSEARFTCTDLDESSTAKVASVMPTSDGRCATPVTKILRVAKSLADGVVLLKREGDVLQVSCKGANIALPLMREADFPSLANDIERDVSVDGDELVRALSRMLPFADSKSDGAPRSGVRIEIVDGTMDIVALDGYKVLVDRLDCTGPDLEVTLPPRFASDLSAVKKPGQLSLGVSEGRVSVAFNRGEMASRAMAGSYPNWRMVVGSKPESPNARVEIGRISSSLNRASSVKERAATVRLEMATSELSVTLNDAEGAGFSESIPCECECEAVTNASAPMLTGALKALRGEDVEIWSDNPTAPIYMTGDEGALAICMPVRVA